MNNSTIYDLNNSTKNKIVKQIWSIGNKHLVIIDESIIKKIGITENSTFFVEQELNRDNTTILMRIKKLRIFEEK
jgi:hypothetical protein